MTTERLNQIADFADLLDRQGKQSMASLIRELVSAVRSGNSAVSSYASDQRERETAMRYGYPTWRVPEMGE